jgi:S1-C subfamily serine protease
MLNTLVSLGLLLSPSQENASLRQAVIARAVERVAPGVVAIETSGGTDVVGQPTTPGARPGAPAVRRGTGPTTGLVVGADGWILSSAFNLANQPASIVVSAGGRRHLAKIVATDSSRMLTLLKIDATGLTVPEAFPAGQIEVGMTSLAVGRALSASADAPPSVSEGIVSALGRIAGKAIQTDAKVSPVNYGGPLVSLDGRVLGILVPASPDAEGATAGFEWYDSGIGFAIPLDDLKRVLPTLQKGMNLSRGVLGVTMAQGDPFRAAPKVTGVRTGSPADKAGLKTGDVITRVNGAAVTTQGQFQRQLGPLYQGEKVNLEYVRDGKTAKADQVELMAPETSRPLAMLGITPLRDTEGPGVVIRSLIPGGPAEKAGLKAGDRLTGLVREQGPPIPIPIADRAMLAMLVESADVGQSLKFIVRRAGAEAPPKPEAKPDSKPEEGKAPVAKSPETVTVALAARPADLFVKPTQAGSALEGAAPPAQKAEGEAEAKKPEVGVLERVTASGDGKYLALVPANYRADLAHGVLLWLHPANRSKDEDLKTFLQAWGELAASKRLIVVAPKCPVESGWTPSDADLIRETINGIAGSHTIDRRRLVAHGLDQGAQMALHMALVGKEAPAGVAILNAGWPGTVRDRVPGKGSAFFLFVGATDPSRPAVQDLFNRVLQKHYAVISKIMSQPNTSYLDAGQMAELAAWMDSMDGL